ncbi:hypothetical protein H6P81_009979 [Aristolochia fimbriata]|uniref:1-phosphatidylinositol 4-kinase n=1 Tax=Aristolochia fimbriata TaxID=158543 RepID=A0AAV7ENB7_ARIFI|nr:hypothetical protein H6P81_009979 [Aristolochia fimbriata]
MAITIEHPHGGLKPLARTRTCKLRSFSHFPDPAYFELDVANLARSVKTAAISAASIKRSISTPCLNTAGRVEEREESSSHAHIEVLAGRGSHGIPALILEATLAIESGGDLFPTPGGLGGAYYLRSDNGTKISVVKPIDDEAGLSKGFVGLILGPQGLARPSLDGETAVREVAAYLLDHGGFAGVPPTALVSISEAAFRSNRSKTMAAVAPAPAPSRMASIQRFVPHDYDAGDLGFSSFSVASVHRIGILDIRILNIDRHTGNILVTKQSTTAGFGSHLNDGCAVDGPTELVPIDHGLCLPEAIEDPYFEWLHWPQASVPFSEAEFDYINGLDPTRDAELLRSELPLLKESSIRVLLLCTIFLQRAAAASLCLADIGDMMTREFGGIREEPSVLDTLCAEAKATMRRVFEGGDDTGGEEGNLDECQFEIDDSEDSTDFPSNPAPQLPSLLQIRRSKPPIMPPKRGPLRSMSEYFREGVLSPLHEEDYWISFKDMNEEEWDSFLERFEELLPEVFESRKNMELNPRLGSSCKF